MEEVSKRPAPAGRQWVLRGATVALASAVGLFASACGGDSSGGSGGDGSPTGSFPVKVVTAEFPPKQSLGQTSLMRIGVKNTGKRTMPGLTISISIAGKEGQASSLPFAIRSPEPGLAQPDRPVWVLSEHYPKLDGEEFSAGAENASANTFDFGPVKSGEVVEAVWKLSAVKAGKFTVLYDVGASLNGDARAVGANDGAAGGSFSATISAKSPNTTVTDSGEVVTLPAKPKQPTR